jgi:hypothetical protein
MRLVEHPPGPTIDLDCDESYRVDATAAVIKQASDDLVGNSDGALRRRV